jgi:hypothetical protein
MKRGRSQVIWRYTPESLFRYNESGGWCRTTEITLRDTKPLTGALAEALRATLAFWRAVGPTGFPDPDHQANRYEVGEPHQVWFTIWPLVFTCRECGMVHYYADLPKLLSVNTTLSCMKCKKQSVLRQVPFAYVHECGRLDSVYIPGGHQRHTIKLINKGSFQESFWFCETCRIPLRRDARAGLGFRACECAPKKAKRGLLLEDSRGYYSQTIALVDIEPQALDRWKENSRFSDLLLAACLRLPRYKPSDLLDLAAWKPTSGDLSPELRTMKDLLIKQGMSEAQADSIVRTAAKQAGADPWVAYDTALLPHRTGACLRPWQSVRRTVEYVFVRDEPSSAAIPLDQLIREAQDAQDTASATRLTDQRDLAAQLGLVRLQIVQALPILLAGIGYSRYFPAPQAAAGDGDQAPQVSLRPFPSTNNKVPIYEARNTTEALLYELDPWRLAAYLAVNLGAPIPDTAVQSEPHLRAWLMNQSAPLIDRGESHFSLTTFETEAGIAVHPPSALIFGVLHTLSHVLKATAHRYVGIDGDALAEYLFPGHAAGLLYVSNHVEFTLGGIDSVFRANMSQWLGSARDYANQCSFDPVCSSSGGACLACLYPKFGCAHFNRTLSRAFLFGGTTTGRGEPIIGFWSPLVTSETNKLLAKRPATTI